MVCGVLRVAVGSMTFPLTRASSRKKRDVSNDQDYIREQSHPAIAIHIQVGTRGFVIDNRPCALRRAYGRIGRTAQRHDHGLVLLIIRVVGHRNRDGLDGITYREGQGPCGERGVVCPRSRGARAPRLHTPPSLVTCCALGVGTPERSGSRWSRLQSRWANRYSAQACHRHR